MGRDLDGVGIWMGLPIHHVHVSSTFQPATAVSIWFRAGSDESADQVYGRDAGGTGGRRARPTATAWRSAGTEGVRGRGRVLHGLRQGAGVVQDARRGDGLLPANR